MQAAILRARLPRLRAWTERRRALAARYRERLAGGPVDVMPECDPGHVYHLFVVRTRQRQELQRELLARGIETLVHYPVPIPAQPAMRAVNPASCPVAARACDEVLSLPLHQRRVTRGGRRRGRNQGDFVRAQSPAEPGSSAPSVGKPIAVKTCSFSTTSTGSTATSTTLKAARSIHRPVNNEALLAELIDRSDVVFHFAARRRRQAIVERPVSRSKPASTAPGSLSANKKKLMVIASRQVYAALDFPFASSIS
jgi:hypothetical protein